MMRIPWLGLLLVSLLTACQKEPVTTPPGPPGYTDPPAYGTPFAGLPATDDLVLYEVNLRAFPSGDFDGVRGRLDAIADLGVNVIWLMPHYPIGTINSVNSPYSVADYNAVATEYGSLDDLRLLVEEAHNRGMAVILDWVANHTAWDHPWISEHPDWYTQVGGEIISPAGTGWLDVADLNFTNDSMQVAMIRALKYWVLVANVDGYRCDAADFVPYTFWARAVDTLRAMPDRNLLLLAEGARNDHLTAGFDLNFGWSFYSAMKSVINDGNPVGYLLTAHTMEYSTIGPGKHRLRFTTNHDESAWDAPPSLLFGGQEPALAAYAATTFIGGVPLIYGSQEVGHSSTVPFFTNSSINWTGNPDVLLAYQDLMEAYATNPSWRSGELVGYATDDMLLFQRATETDSGLVAVNLRSFEVSASLPMHWRERTVNDALEGSPTILDTALTLPAWGYRLLEIP